MARRAKWNCDEPKSLFRLVDLYPLSTAYNARERRYALYVGAFSYGRSGFVLAFHLVVGLALSAWSRRLLLLPEFVHTFPNQG